MNESIQKELIKWAFILIIALIILSYVKKGFKGIAPSIGIGRTNEEIQKAESYVKEVAKTTDKKKLSYKPENFVNWAQVLYSAYKGVGTDETTAKRIFSYVNNIDDLKALVVAFGIRDGMNLNEYTRDELSNFSPSPWTFTITALNEMLAKKKINYRF